MRFTIVSTIVTYLICYAGTALASGSAGASCTPSLSNSSDGFQAKFFKYIYPDYAGESSDEYFITTGYNKPDRLITTLNGITDINFYHFYNFNTDGPTWGLINDYNITISNFTVEYTGWFIPKESGDYTFQIGQTDDGSRIEIYEDSSYQCCDMTVNKTVLQNLQYYDSSHISTATINMEAGISYPIKVVYFNKDSVAIETIQFTDPSGSIHKTFDGYVVHYKDIICPTTTPEEESISFAVISSNVVSSNAISPSVTSSSVTSSSVTSSSVTSSSVTSSTETSSGDASLSTTSFSDTSLSTTPLSTTPSSIISPSATTSVAGSSVSELYSSSNTFTSIVNSRLSSLNDPIISRFTTPLEVASSSLSYSSSSNLTSSTSTSSISPTSTVSLIFITSSISTTPINISPEMDIIPLTTNPVKSFVAISSSVVSNTPSPTSSKTTIIDKSPIVSYSTISSKMISGQITTLASSSDPEPSNIGSSSILAHVMTLSIAPSSTSTSSFSNSSFNNSSPRGASSKTSSETNTMQSHSSIFHNGTSRLSSIRVLSQSTHSYDSSISLLSTQTIHSNKTSATESVVKSNREIDSVLTMSHQAIDVHISSIIQYVGSSCSNTTRTSRYVTVSTTCSTDTPHTSYTNQNIDLQRSNIGNDIVSTVPSIKYSSIEAKSNTQTSVTNVGTKLISDLAVQSTTSQNTESTSHGIQININGGISVNGNNGMTYLILLMLTSFI